MCSARIVGTQYTVSLGQSDTSGWVPISLTFDSEMGLPSFRAARWLDCSGVTFSDAFFLQTIVRLRSQARKRREVLTNMAAFERVAAISLDHAPSGLIFHVSRCGSTAVANALKRASGQVISEPWPLTQLIWLSALHGERMDAQYDLSKLVRTISWSLATCRFGRPEPTVLKLTSSSLLALEVLAAKWPAVPRALIIRHPVEVLVASLGRGGWIDLRDIPERGKLLAGLDCTSIGSLHSMSEEEFGARVLGNYFEIARRNLSQFQMVIDHSEISLPIIEDLVKLFALDIADPATIVSELRRHSKSNGRAPYIADSRPKRQVGTKRVLNAVERWAMAPYLLLLEERHTRSIRDQHEHAARPIYSDQSNHAHFAGEVSR